MEFNLAVVFNAVATTVPDRDCIVFGDRRLTFAEIDDRTARLARVLHDWGLGARCERSELAGHQSGQAHLALYMTNANEYVEGMLGAYRARVAPFNVNYRYVSDELVYLLDNAHAAAVMYHALWEMGMPEALPGGQEWRERIDAFPAEERHLRVHEQHLVGINEWDRPVVDAETITALTLTGTAADLAPRLDDLAAQGATEIVFHPGGDDPVRELERFATVVRSTVG